MVSTAAAFDTDPDAAVLFAAAHEGDAVQKLLRSTSRTSSPEYNSLMETVYLLKSPANAEHLRKSIEQYRDGNVQERDLLDE